MDEPWRDPAADREWSDPNAWRGEAFRFSQEDARMCGLRLKWAADDAAAAFRAFGAAWEQARLSTASEITFTRESKDGDDDPSRS